MTQLTLAQIPTINDELERLRYFYTHDAIDVSIRFEDVLSEFYREAIKHTSTVQHTTNVFIDGPRMLVITGVN